MVMSSTIAFAVGTGLGIAGLKALSPNEAFFGLGHSLFGLEDLLDEARRAGGGRGFVVHLLGALIAAPCRRRRPACAASPAR